METALKVFVSSKKAPSCLTHFQGIISYKTNSHENYSSLQSDSNKGAPFLEDTNAFKANSIKIGPIIIDIYTF